MFKNENDLGFQGFSHYFWFTPVLCSLLTIVVTTCMGNLNYVKTMNFPIN